MRAVQSDVHGGPEVLVVREADEPECGPGEVLVRTVASSLGPKEFHHRRGSHWQPGGRPQVGLRHTEMCFAESWVNGAPPQSATRRSSSSPAI